MRKTSSGYQPKFAPATSGGPTKAAGHINSVMGYEIPREMNSVRGNRTGGTAPRGRKRSR